MTAALPPRSVALIYDRLVRPDTTGVHVEAALRTLGCNVHYYPPLVPAPAGLKFAGYQKLPPDCDLYLQIDDDLSYPGPVHAHPSVYWCIDVHRLHTMVGGWSRLQKAAGFDHLFVAQKDGLQAFPQAQWLPLAFHQGLHRKLPGIAKRYDWCFLGSLEFARRVELTERLKSAFPNCLVGQAYGEDLVQIYNQSKIILNISVGNDLNMRYFEAMACGGLLLSNAIDNGEQELFPTLAIWRNFDDLCATMAHFLDHEEERAALAEQQHRAVLTSHGYEQRMAQLFKTLGRSS